MTQTLRIRPLSISPRRDSGIAPRPGSSWRKELGIGEAEPVVVPDHVWTEQAHRINLRPLDITSLICGDPLPGESALDRMPCTSAEAVQDVLPRQICAHPPHEIAERVPSAPQRAALIAARDGGKLTLTRAHTFGTWSLWVTDDGNSCHRIDVVAACRRRGWLVDAPGYEQAMKPCWTPVVITGAGLAALNQGE